jgi:hypothetical protein
VNVTIGDYGLNEAREVVNPEEAMGQFRKMKSEAEQVISKLESFQHMATRFVEEASETLNLNISKGEEFLDGVQSLVESSEVQRNPLLQALIQLMNEDLAWFKSEAARLSVIRRYYTEMSELSSKPGSTPESPTE